MSSDSPAAKNRSWWNQASDRYQADQGAQLTDNPAAWGIWSIPEQELQALGEVEGLDVLELGCGAAQWSIVLAGRGARPVGLDLTEKQLSNGQRLIATAGVRVPLVQASGESVPFRDASFDVVFCDHGAMNFARPERTVAEAARVLRPGGRFVFNMSSPFLDVCWQESSNTVSTRLESDYFSLYRLEDDDCVTYQLPYGAWIRLFRTHDLVVEDLIEIQPPADAETTFKDYVSLEWARRWPAENIWKLRKALPSG